VVFKGTVFENIYYGLKIRGKEKEKSYERILKLLEKLNLEGYEYRDASTLSGGETQRIALARALITDPEILLLDEPTANLDPGSTENIESMIEDLSQKNLTIIMATHNLLQGQRLSDEIVILNKKIYQIGRPEEIFRKPKSKFVADFVGMKNVKLGQTKMKNSDELTKIDLGKIKIYSSTPLEGRVFISIRPEDITISKQKVKLSALNEFKGIVKGIKDTGTLINLEVDVGEIFTVYMTRKSFLDLKITMGTDIWIQFKASSVHVF
jgi:molybdopterin-binding protein